MYTRWSTVILQLSARSFARLIIASFDVVFAFASLVRQMYASLHHLELFLGFSRDNRYHKNTMFAEIEYVTFSSGTFYVVNIRQDLFKRIEGSDTANCR